MSWDPTRPSNTRAARTMRARVFREQPVCAVTGCGRPSTQDDHIVGWSAREKAGLTVPQWHARSNHQGLCEEHHAAKTQAESIRPSRMRPARQHPANNLQ